MGALTGVRVVVTRPTGQAVDLSKKFAALGATVDHWPGLAITDPDDWSSADRAIMALETFDWIVFTSANGVRHFASRLRDRRPSLQWPLDVSVAAIGPATAAELVRSSLLATLVADEHNSETLAQALASHVVGRKVLLIRGQQGRLVLRNALNAVASVREAIVYRQMEVPPPPEVLAKLYAGGLHVITLTSSNIARNVLKHFDARAKRLVLAEATRLVTLSPITSATVRELGFPVHGEAIEYHDGGLVEAVVKLLA